MTYLDSQQVDAIDDATSITFVESRTSVSNGVTITNDKEKPTSSNIYEVRSPEKLENKWDWKIRDPTNIESPSEGDEVTSDSERKVGTLQVTNEFSHTVRGKGPGGVVGYEFEHTLYWDGDSDDGTVSEGQNSKSVDSYYGFSYSGTTNNTVIEKENDLPGAAGIYYDGSEYFDSFIQVHFKRGIGPLSQDHYPKSGLVGLPDGNGSVYVRDADDDIA
jgi:hypothetical protein